MRTRHATRPHRTPSRAGPARRHRAPLVVVLAAFASAAVVTACGPEHDDAVVARHAAAPFVDAPDIRPADPAPRP